MTEPRNQPYRLSSPLDSSQIEQLDQMLQELYEDLGSTARNNSSGGATLPIDLTTDVTGTLPVGNGGTGVTSLGTLTRVNDTNVILTLGGTPAGSLIKDVSLTLSWSGTLSAARGGTGVGTLGDITKTDDTNVTLTLGGTPVGSVITSVSFTLGWTGTLAVGRGGTGVGSLGDLTKTDDTNVTLSLGGTPTGALIKATSLTLGWTGTLATSRGGLGQSAAGVTNGQIPIGSSTGSFTLATITPGSGISITNGAGSISVAITGTSSAAHPIPWSSIRQWGWWGVPLLGANTNTFGPAISSGSSPGNIEIVTGGGTQTSVVDAVSPWIRLTPSTGSGNQRPAHFHAVNSWCWLDHLPIFSIRMRTGADVTTSYRLWCQITNAAGATSKADSLATEKYVGVRYSTSASDAGFMIAHSNGTTQTIGSKICNIATNTSYRIDITVTSTTTFTVEIFDANGASLGSQSSSVDAASLGTAMFSGLHVQNTNNSTVNAFDFAGAYLERN